MRLALATALPNLPILVVRGVLHLKGSVLDVDFFLLALLLCGSPVLASVLFLLTYALELVRLLDALYYFSRNDPLFAARFVVELRPTLVAAWAAAFVAVAGLALWAWRAVLPRVRGRRLWRAALPVALVLLALTAVDQVRGFMLLGENRHARAGYRAVDEVLLRVPALALHPVPVVPVAAADSSASAPLWNAAAFAQRRENVLLVNVESMGQLLDRQGAQREFALFHDAALEQRYAVHSGTVRFTGSTVAGEMRELCRLRTGMFISSATLAGRSPCLPAQYRDAGYDTAAFHGFRSTMFQRAQWYPLLGFTRTTFLADMADLPACDGAFYGACDRAVAHTLQQRLQAHAAGAFRPQFLYWMTLNSHLPVNQAQAPAGECPITAGSAVCAQLLYVQDVLRSVRAIALDPKIGRTAIVIVGDHAPPFLRPEDRSRFDPGNVPFVYLEPR